MRLVRTISKEIVPESVFEDFLRQDPELHGRLLHTAIAAGREAGLSPAQLDALESAADAVDDRLRSLAIDAGKVRRDSALGAPRYIRYHLNEDRAITGLDLQGRFLPLIEEFFDIGDRDRLQELGPGIPPTGMAHLVVPPGLLGLKTEAALPEYGATLRLTGETATLRIPAAEVAEVQVEVTNNSPCAWYLPSGSRSNFGVSYHLLSADNRMRVWDQERTYLLATRWNCISFIEPSRTLTCSVRIAAPRRPGWYQVQFDLVHENVTWFSAHGNVFPTIELEVIGEQAERCYAIAGREIVYERVGEETAIIDTIRGTYYTVKGYGSLIWHAIADGHDPAGIIAAFAAADMIGAKDADVVQFLESLLREQLIVPSECSDRVMRGEFSVTSSHGTQPPVLTRHAGAPELLKMHPVRDASEESGWPYPPEADGQTGQSTDATGLAR